MRLQLKRVKGRPTDREIVNLIIAEGTLTYLINGAECGVDLDNINYLVVTDSAPTLAAEVARLQAENEAMREALLMVQCRLNTRPGGIVYFTGEEWTQIDKALGGE